MAVECGELLYGRRFPLGLKGTVLYDDVRPAILYGSRVWCVAVWKKVSSRAERDCLVG